MYRIGIVNHRIIGHPYIPICKFQLFGILNGREKSEESDYINPPLDMYKNNSPQKELSKNKSTTLNDPFKDESYTKQFPITFDSILLKENDLIQIKLVQLTKNGREKQIGYSKMIINYEVINKTTKHKIVKIDSSTVVSNNQNSNFMMTGEALSIIDLCVQMVKGTKSNINSNIKNTGINYNSNTLNQNISKLSGKKQPNSTMKSQLPSYTLQEQSQQQYENEDDSQIDENAKFQYNDQSGYYQDQSYTNQNISNLTNKRFDEKVIFQQNKEQQRNQYIFKANTNINNNNNTYNSNKNVQQFMNSRYGRIKTQVGNQKQFSLKDKQKQKSLQLQRFDSVNKVSGKIYKQHFLQRKNNHGIDPDLQRNNNRSRRYLIQQRKDVEQQQKNQDSRVKSFSQNNNINTFGTIKNQQLASQSTQNIINNNNSKAKRRLKYIFSNNQLRYLSTVNNNQRQNKQNELQQLMRAQQEQTKRKQNYGNQKLNNEDKSGKQLVRSPFMRKYDQDVQQDHSYINESNNKSHKHNHSLKQHLKKPYNNNIMLQKYNSISPTRQNPTIPNQPQIPLQQQQPLQYFITLHQTNPQNCYILKNLYIVYEVQKNNQTNNKNKQSQFKPKFITFLTYNSFQKVVKINCLSNQLTNQNNPNSKKLKYLDAKQSNNFILKSLQGQIKPSAVCEMFSCLQLFLPKYCLIFRVQVIMEDQSIFIGTLANQLGSNIKSSLHLKKSLHNQNTNNSTINLQLPYQSINLIFDICDLNSQQRQQSNLSKNIHNNETFQNLKKEQDSNNVFKGRSFVQNESKQKKSNKNTFSIEKNQFSQSPSKQKQLRQSTIQCLPNINLVNQLSNNQSQGKLLPKNDTNNSKERGREQSPIQKTLNAIKAYKICLSPMTGPVFEVNKNQTMKNSLQYRTGQNYHINFDSFNNNDKSPYDKSKAKQNHILLQQQQNDRQQDYNNNLNDSVEESDIQYLMRKDISEVRMKTTISKDLPKIIIHRSNLKPLNLKKQTSKNIKQDISSIIKKRNKSTSQDRFSYKNQVRLQFFKKILGNKYMSSQHKNSSIESLKNKRNHYKHSHSKSKIFLNQKRNEMASKKYKKLSTLPYCDFNSTKIFSNDDKSNYHKHIKSSISPHKYSKKQTYARQLRCLKDHMISNSSLSNHKDREQSQQKNHKKYKISIRKIDFLKLLDNRQGSVQKIQKKYISDNENSDIQMKNNESLIKDSQNCQVFLKLFNESTKRKKQFITPSQGLKKTLNQKSTDDSHKNKNKTKKSSLELDYLSCSWVMSRQQLMFKKIKLDDLITVQAYGDLASVDNHEFLGKCIFSVKEMLYMKDQNKITGYLVKQKKIGSHVTVHFEIDEINY